MNEVPAIDRIAEFEVRRQTQSRDSGRNPFHFCVAVVNVGSIGLKTWAAIVDCEGACAGSSSALGLGFEVVGFEVWQFRFKGLGFRFEFGSGPLIRPSFRS